MKPLKPDKKNASESARTRNGELPIRKILGEKVARKHVQKRMLDEEAKQLLREEAGLAVEREKKCTVQCVRLLRLYSPLESSHSMYEVDSDLGTFMVIRSRTGEHTIIQQRSAPTF